MRFEILNITKTERGLSLSFSYDDEFESVVRKFYNKPKVTKKDIQSYVFFVVNQTIN